MAKRLIIISMAAFLSFGSIFVAGCATDAQTGALIGGAGGAAMGAATGGFGGAVLGGALGAGAGYIVGNEMDK